jgi:WD40 repeat protein
LLADLTYDDDDRRKSLAVHASTNVTTNYGYDQASRLFSLHYLANDVLLGDLEYAFDPDGRDKQTTGSLAAFTLTGVPASPGAPASATYGNANELLTWNTNGSNLNSNNAIHVDPATNLTYSYDERTLINSITNGSTLATAYQYDPLFPEPTKC